MTAALAALLALAAAGALFARHRDGRSRKEVEELRARLAESERACGEQAALAEHYLRRDRLLVGDSDEARFIVDQADGALLEINRAAEELLGYTGGEVVHLTYKVLFSRQHRQRVLRLFGEADRRGAARIDEIRFRRKDGSQFIGEITARTGTLQGRRVFYGCIRDVTATVNLQLELRRQNRHLTLLNDIAHRVAEGHDLQQTLEIVLDRVIDSLGISGGGIFLLEQRGTEMRLALHRGIPAEVVAELGSLGPGAGLAGKVAETGRPRVSTNLQKDHRRVSSAVQQDRWRAFMAIPFIADERPLGVLFVFDRGERVFQREDMHLLEAVGRQIGPLLKNAELFEELQWQHRLNSASLRELERSRAALRDHLEELEQHHRTLKGLNRMKSAFLSLASHELRTPLTTILSGAEFLQGQSADALGESECRALEVVIRGCERLNNIVDDLVEAARLEARDIYIAREAVELMPTLRQLLDEFAPACAGRGLSLALGDFPVECRVRGDLHHLKRAFARLLENAVKFTPEGGWIRISGALRERDEVAAQSVRLRPFTDSFFDGALAEQYLQVSVCDSGIGIDAADQVRIFDKFQEVGDISGHSTSRAGFGGKGVGLGLTLARGVFEAHEGLAWVESAGTGQGSCFAALLPLAAPGEGRYVLG